MAKKELFKKIAGTNLAAGFTMSLSGQVLASTDTFSTKTLTEGYRILADHHDMQGKCGKGKCGKGKYDKGKCAGHHSNKQGMGKCGKGKCGSHNKQGAGKCGSGKCGSGKCGEGKCGSHNKQGAGKCATGKCAANH